MRGMSSNPSEMDVRKHRPMFENYVKVIFGHGAERLSANRSVFGQGLICPTSALLMHEDEDADLCRKSAFTRAAREWPPLPTLAFLRPLKGLFEL